MPELPTSIDIQTDDFANTTEPSTYVTSSGSTTFVGCGPHDHTLVRHALVRFPSLEVAKGAIIESATLGLECMYGYAGTAKITVSAVKEADAAMPTDRTGYDALTFTTAEVSRDCVADSFDYNSVYNVDVADIITEIINLTDWSVDDSIIFSVRDNGSSQTENNFIGLYPVYLAVTIGTEIIYGVGTNSGMLLSLSQAVISSGVSSGFLAGLSQAAIVDGRSAGLELTGAGDILAASATGMSLQGAGLFIPTSREQGMSLSLSGWIEPSARQSGMTMDVVLPPGFNFTPFGRNAGIVIKGAAELEIGRNHGMSISVLKVFTGELLAGTSSGIVISGAAECKAGSSAGLSLTGFRNNVLRLSSGRKHGLKITGNHINGYIKNSGRKHGLMLLGSVVKTGRITAGTRSGFSLGVLKNNLGYFVSGVEHGLLMTGDVERVGYLTAGIQMGSSLVIIPVVPDVTTLLQYKRDSNV